MHNDNDLGSVSGNRFLREACFKKTAFVRDHRLATGTVWVVAAAKTERTFKACGADFTLSIIVCQRQSLSLAQARSITVFEGNGNGQFGAALSNTTLAG